MYSILYMSKSISKTYRAISLIVIHRHGPTTHGLATTRFW